LFRRYHLSWPAHYHQICVENIAVGALAARGHVIRPPYKSKDLSGLLGLDPDGYWQHTALGDAYWARDMYDAAMQPIVPVVAVPAVADAPPSNPKGLLGKVLGR